MNHFKMTVTSKGQVTLPAEYRRALGIDAGSTLTLLLDEDGSARLRKSRSMGEFVGSLADAAAELGRPLIRADIEEAVSDAVSERRTRSRRGKAR